MVMAVGGWAGRPGATAYHSWKVNSCSFMVPGWTAFTGCSRVMSLQRSNDRLASCCRSLDCTDRPTTINLDTGASGADIHVRCSVWNSINTTLLLQATCSWDDSKGFHHTLLLNLFMVVIFFCKMHWLYSVLLPLCVLAGQCHSRVAFRLPSHAQGTPSK